MTWFRNNFIAIVFLLAVAGSFWVAKVDSSRRDRNIVDAAVSVCERTSNGTAYDVVFKFLVAKSARGRGESEFARKTEFYARGKLRTLPAPQSFGNDEQELMQLVETDQRNGRIVLSPRAVRLQREGCERLFN